MADELGIMIYNLMREIKTDLADIKDELCTRKKFGGQVIWKHPDDPPPVSLDDLRDH